MRENTDYSFLWFLIVFLTLCTWIITARMNPRFEEDSSLIIHKVKIYDQGEKYFIKNINNDSQISKGAKTVIYAPRGTWQVGDTIKLNKFK